MLPGQAAGVKGEIVLDMLLRQYGRAGRHAAHHRDLIRRGLHLRRAGAAADRDGPGLPLRLGDESGGLQPLQMKMHRGGGFQPHRLPNLPHRRGIAMVLLEGDDIVVNLLLLVGELLHGRPSSASQAEHKAFRALVYIYSNAILSYNRRKVKHSF